jgi:hypothetical protein
MAKEAIHRKMPHKRSVTAAQFPHQFALPPTHASKRRDNRTHDTALEIPLTTSLAQNVCNI